MGWIGERERTNIAGGTPNDVPVAEVLESEILLRKNDVALAKIYRKSDGPEADAARPYCVCIATELAAFDIASRATCDG